MSEWISVDDKLPGDNAYIFVFHKDDIEFAFYYADMNMFDMPEHGWAAAGSVKYWMLLPEPPKDK